MRVVIDLNGPPGSGKSTLAKRILSRIKGTKVLGLTAFGFPVYQLAWLIARIRVGNSLKEGLEKDYNPISLLDRDLRRKVLRILVPIEIFGSFLRLFVRVRFSMLFNKVIILDEGLVNALAFYVAEGQRLEDMKMVQKLVSFYSKLYLYLKKVCNIHIIFIDESDDILTERWQRRGHPHTLFTRHVTYDDTHIEWWSNIIRKTSYGLRARALFDFLYIRDTDNVEHMLRKVLAVTSANVGT